MNGRIEKTTFIFLKDLAKNNYADKPEISREWFNKNKHIYVKAHTNMSAFADALLAEMRKHDSIETASGKDSLMRIYRDTRFSNNKTPYKNYFGGGFRRATRKLRGGYYFQIGPGVSLAAGGFFSPNPADLLRIRKDIDSNHKYWKKILSNKRLINTFSELQGEKVATSPKGFSIENPALKLIRYKQFYFERKFTDKEVLADNFLKELNETFKNLRSYFNHMSEVLTTDANGISII